MPQKQVKVSAVISEPGKYATNAITAHSKASSMYINWKPVY